MSCSPDCNPLPCSETKSCPKNKNFQCDIKNSYCQCKTGYHLSIDYQSCIPLACGPQNHHGTCPSGQGCYLGKCVDTYGCIDDKCYTGKSCKYSCSGNTCVRSANGTYTSSDCDGQCQAPAYTCEGNKCVMAAGGQYTTSTCDGSCSNNAPRMFMGYNEYNDSMIPTLEPSSAPPATGKDVIDALLTPYKSSDPGNCPAGTGFLLSPQESICYKNEFKSSSGNAFMKNMASQLPIAFNRDSSNGDNTKYVGTNFGNYNNQTELQVLFASEADKDSMSPYACAPPNSLGDPYCSGRGSGAQCYPGLDPVMVSNGWQTTETLNIPHDTTNQKYYSVWGCSANPVCPEGYAQQPFMANGAWKYGCARVLPTRVSNEDLCHYVYSLAECGVKPSCACADPSSACARWDESGDVTLTGNGDIGYSVVCRAGSLPATCNSSQANDTFSSIYPGMGFITNQGTTANPKYAWEICSDPNGCDPPHRVKKWSRDSNDDLTGWSPGALS